MLNGYTFSKNSTRGLYYCSKNKMKYNKCTASVKLNESGIVQWLRENHNHPPPTFMKTSGGLYMKIGP